MSIVSCSRRLLPLGVLLLATACTTARPLPASLHQAGLVLHELGRVTPGSPLAWGPDGERLAVVTGRGLELVPLHPEEPRRLLRPGRPLALAWSPDGLRLAASWTEEESSRLEILDLSGHPLASRKVTGTLPFLDWSGPRPLAARAELTRYSFGGRYLLEFLSWDGSGEPVRRPLWDTTLAPGALEVYGPQLLLAPRLAISPLGDELALVEIHDPPAYPPYGRLKLLHLASGAEREVAIVPPVWAPGTFLTDGETLVYGTPRGAFARRPRFAAEAAALARDGPLLAASPGGRNLLAGKRLWSAGEPAAELEVPERAAFSPDGSRLALIHRGRLYVVAGLPADPAPRRPADAAAWRELRDWSARGLITPADYARSYGELLP